MTCLSQSLHYLLLMNIEGLKVSDIGRDWVHLTWNRLAGKLICNNVTYMNIDEMNNKNSMTISFNILEAGFSYNCSIVNDSKHLRNNHVNFTLGKNDELFILTN